MIAELILSFIVLHIYKLGQLFHKRDFSRPLYISECWRKIKRRS